MDVLKAVLAARPERSLQVEELLAALAGLQLEVCICSPGGVGSTELSNFLTRDARLACNLLTDQDAMRHASRPPAGLGAGTVVVYLFGDPLACVASHYRRGHAHHQALKTSGRPDLGAAGFPANFDAYVARGEDLFGLERHLDSWLRTPTPYDVLFVRYEAMFDLPVATAMLAHICGQRDRGGSASSSSAAALAAGSSAAAGAAGSSAAAAAAGGGGCGGRAAKSEQEVAALAAAFAARKRPRASQVTEEQRRAMYGALAARMDALPPIFLRTADCRVLPLLAS
ncbi:hypothetical protein HT031_000586 [Scenedesmus sp. PABB004]|nr:hypothetical protein HT031_000586 [Scenedesmus sp. PABB004]